MGLPVEPAAPRQRWGLAQRVAFRFAFVYLVLYILPFPVNSLPLRVDPKEHPAIFEWVTKPYQDAAEWVVNPYRDGMDAAVLWIGKHVFDLDITIRPGGSGDTTWNYVQIFGLAVLSAALTLVWSLLAMLWSRLVHKRSNYDRLHEWLRVYVRFYLALKMISYGVSKVIKTQFPTPVGDGLLASYGESSPMHLLWTFMGASEGYNWFTGGGEMLAGLLLLTRRTTLLGALVTFGVMAHVTALNFCYDVPVKLFSMHLVLIAVFLMAPDLPWLVRVLVLGQSEARRAVTPLTRWRWVNGVLVFLRTAFVVGVVWQGLDSAWLRRTTTGDLAPRPPLAGLWEVQEFAADGQVRPPLTTDAARWQYVTISPWGTAGAYFGVRTMTGARTAYLFSADPDKNTISLSRLRGLPGSTPPALAELKYASDSEGVMIVEGALRGRQIWAKLRRVDESEFLLLNRGFHWINETPYNVVLPRGAGGGR